MIKVEHLAKSFGTKRAVDDISFEVARGEVLGFLGPNGAGKSTTMRMITGYLTPSSGFATVSGFDVEKNPIEAKRRIGYLPESAPSYSDMTVAGFLGWAAEMRGLSGTEKSRAVGKAIETCSLESVAHQEIDTLSKGFRHRTCLAQSIIHDPEVLILDEPTDGLDPNQKFEVRNLIKRMGETKAIIFSTHILEEVEAACTRAIIIDRGSIVANGTPEQLKARSDRQGAVVVTLRGASAEAAQAAVTGVPGVTKAELLAQSPDSITLRAFADRHAAAPGGALAARLTQAIAAKGGWTIDELHTESGRLDDVFRSLTKSDTLADGWRA